MKKVNPASDQGPDELSSGLTIPYDRLSQTALRGVIEEFITREGTEYGSVELSLDEKVEQVLAQLRDDSVVIVFDPVDETCSLQLNGSGHRLR